MSDSDDFVGRQSAAKWPSVSSSDKANAVSSFESPKKKEKKNNATPQPVLPLEVLARREEVLARQEMLQALRSQPKIFIVLDIQESACDNDLLHALSRNEDVFPVLREAGFRLPEVIRLEEILPLALIAPGPPKRPTIDWKKVTKVTVVFVPLVLALGLVFLAIYLSQKATSGWKMGKCSLSTFSNMTCRQKGGGCLLEVSVKAEGKLYSKDRWSVPMERSYLTGNAQFKKTDAFRCCDQEMKMDCCSFFNPILSGGAFCDKWGPARGINGADCPSDDWPCLLQLSEGDGKEINDLREYEPPLIWPYLSGAGLLFGCTVCAVCGSALDSLGVLLASAARAKDAARERTAAVAAAMAGASKNVVQSQSSDDDVKVVQVPAPSQAVGRRSLDVSRDKVYANIVLPGTIVSDEDMPAPPAPKANLPMPPPSALASASLFLTEAEEASDEDGDANPALKGGDLSAYANKSIEHLMPPLIAPLPKRPSPAGFAVDHGAGDLPAAWPWAGQADVVAGHHVLDVGRPASGRPASLRMTAQSPHSPSSSSGRLTSGRSSSGRSASGRLASSRPALGRPGSYSPPASDSEHEWGTRLPNGLPPSAFSARIGRSQSAISVRSVPDVGSPPGRPRASHHRTRDRCDVELEDIAGSEKVESKAWTLM